MRFICFVLTLPWCLLLDPQTHAIDSRLFPVTDFAEDSGVHQILYFVRNRFELHPENGQPNDVLLGLLHSQIYGRATTNSTSAPAVDRNSQRLLELINQARSRARLAPVALSGTLARVATSYSQVQAEQGRISHIGPDGSKIGNRVSRSGYRWSMVAENLAAGYRGPDEVFAGWMRSAGHRANILNARARHLGVGHTRRSDDPRRFFDYWVLVLAAPR